MAELQQLQNALATPERNNLVAIVSLTEMVVLKPALNQFGRWDAEDHRRRVELLIAAYEGERTAAFSRRAGQLLYRAGKYCPLLAYGAHHHDGRVNSACRRAAVISIRI